MFSSDSLGKNRIRPVGGENGAVTAATNLSSTKKMVAALQRSERVTESNVGLATLALTTARALDEVLGSDEKRYVLDRLARAHLAVLLALEQSSPPAEDDDWALFMAAVTTPTPGETAGPASDRL
jgi:hypothetical protein